MPLGITVGAEFDIHQDRNSGHLRDTVIARELSAFPTTLYFEESRIALTRELDGVAVVKSRVGTEEQGRIHVADEVSFKKTIASMRNFIEEFKRDFEEFDIALENGKDVSNIYDLDVTNCGFTYMPNILFNPHRRRTFRRTLQTGQHGLARKVEIEWTELEKDQESDEYDELVPVAVNGPTASRKGRMHFNVQARTISTFNNCHVPLYPPLPNFDNSDWTSVSITTSGCDDADIQF